MTASNHRASPTSPTSPIAPTPPTPPTWRALGRRLWQVPSNAFERRKRARRIEFLELFFDLVFVVLVSQLAHRLAESPSWSGVGWFAFLFLAVWASWTNGTVYHDSHGTDDLSIRVFTFGLMLSVAFMAVFVGHVPGNGAAGFALAYAANSALLTILWYRTGFHDRAHRVYSYPYAAAYVAATGLFCVSVAVRAPMMYWLWAAALTLELAAAIPSIRLWQLGGDHTIATPSLIERLGLFVIIVLGEVVAGAVNGMAHHDTVTAEVAVVGLLGILVAIALWWLYFDGISHRHPSATRQFAWTYLHFPLVLGIAAAGAGVLVLLQQLDHLSAQGRWLLVGSVALSLAMNVAITRTLDARLENPRLYGTNAIASAVSIVLMLLVGTSSLGSMGTLGVVVAVLFGTIGVNLAAWVRTVVLGEMGAGS
ncbi:MAG: low temperature requirement protein A [Ardenticatenales bacterium]